jgi:hypothetical protein
MYNFLISSINWSALSTRPRWVHFGIVVLAWLRPRCVSRVSTPNESTLPNRDINFNVGSNFHWRHSYTLWSITGRGIVSSLCLMIS